MKQILLTIFFLTSLIFSQLRVGVDMSRKMTEKITVLKSNTKIDGVGFTLGYEKILLSLVGVGAEYTVGGDYMDTIQGYAVAKVPVGVPMLRGVVRLGYSKILGDWEKDYDGGLSYGFGVRLKLPVIPIGIEALYSIHELEKKSKDVEDVEDVEDVANLFGQYEISNRILNLTATYSF